MTRSAALWCASAALVAGCVEPRTSVLLRVESELSWGEGARVQSVVVEVRRDGATGPLRSQRVTALGVGAGRSSLPLLIEARESTGDVSAPLWVEALGCATPNGCDRDGAVVAQRAVVRFVERETLRVTLLLASACAGVRCDTSERCETTSGACVPVVGEGSVDAGRDAAVDRVEVDAITTDVRDATTMDAADAGERDVEQDVTTLDAGIDGGSVDATIDAVADRSSIDVAGDAPRVPDVPTMSDVGRDAATGRCPTGMVFIPGGEFEMGSTSGWPNEAPVHRVRVSAFCIDRTEVTVAAYRECPASMCAAPLVGGQCNWEVSGRDDHPVNCVSWGQADSFCRWRDAGLPSEAQWEFTARGIDGRTYPWGEDRPNNQLCWSGVTGTRLSTCSVGMFPTGASPFGVLDLAGNVWEWVSDWFGSYLASPMEAMSDPLGPAEGSQRITRGGGKHNDVADDVRSARRNPLAPGIQYHDVGFRCVARPLP